MTTARPASRWPRCCAGPVTRPPFAPRARGIQVLLDERFDCIVTDLKMPGMSGVEFIVQLRKAPAGRASRDGHRPRLGVHGGRGHAPRGVRLHRKAVQCRSTRTAGERGDPPRPACAAGSERRPLDLRSTADDRLQFADATAPGRIAESPPRPKPCSLRAKAAQARNWSPARSTPPAGGAGRNSSASIVPRLRRN